MADAVKERRYEAGCSPDAHGGDPVSSAIHDIPREALKVLALPSLDTLADAKVHGAKCVWCGEKLTAETAVDLGEQMSPHSGTTSLMRWFPRACRGCVADRAHRGLFAHGSTCELCRNEKTAADCSAGRGLYRLVREYRQ
ncbi:hypothetical protein [Streptomyces sp. NPDC047009]|uniref:hypothetical protein n=1 Tax=Streptomyces sp. NPDC047009 TaxID=3154496 RepID=UPI0033D0E18D